ncbi:MAG: hypothetical protein LQ351_006824 [Letrouitia transgressa]|nr:MAG: hypothetical protein LQ351_006824 [Letrouitia transgressa]
MVSNTPILSSAGSSGEAVSLIGSFSNSYDFGNVSSISFSLTPASSNSFPLPTDAVPSTSVRLGTGVSATLSDASPSTGVSIDTSASNGVSSASIGYSSAPVNGAFRATPTEPTQAFPSYEAPTRVVTGIAATSKAAQLSGLFFAIYANRDHITDSNLKQDYIDSVRKTKEETDALFNALDVKLEVDPACLNTKQRRHIISEKNLVGDAAKLLSCATKVVDNLVKAVEAPVPPISEIEILTDTLNDIAEDLKKRMRAPTQPSATQETTTQDNTASSTASSCGVSSAIPRCTETVTLSTSFISGTPTVQALTTEVCATITACGESASTAFTTVSTGTSTGGIVRATSCVECANPVVKRSGSLYERSLDDPGDFDSNNQYVLEQIEQFQGVEELEHKQSGRLSSAIIRPFERTPRHLYVAGLFGCTSVVIISEIGVWFSHHWEAPSFEADDETFDRQVLSEIRDGDPEDPVRMPGPYQFAQGDTVNPLSGDGLLNPKFNVQMFVSTPKDPDTVEEIFKTRVDQIVDLLVGEDKPWAGVEPTRRDYLKPTHELQQRQFQLRANSKILIEYDNDQEAPFGDEPHSKQQAIYRVWLEQQVYTHQWDAIDNLQIGATCSNPN